MIVAQESQIASLPTNRNKEMIREEIFNTLLHYKSRTGKAKQGEHNRQARREVDKLLEQNWKCEFHNISSKQN